MLVRQLVEHRAPKTRLIGGLMFIDFLHASYIFILTQRFELFQSNSTNRQVNYSRNFNYTEMHRAVQVSTNIRSCSWGGFGLLADFMSSIILLFAPQARNPESLVAVLQHHMAAQRLSRRMIDRPPKLLRGLYQ